jgi:hypothetical protein
LRILSTIKVLKVLIGTNSKILLTDQSKF